MENIVTFNQHRRESNPQEKKFYDAAIDFKKSSSIIFDQAILGCNGNGKPNQYLTEREEQIVFSTLQWLGSPVGQSFLDKAGFVPKTI